LEADEELPAQAEAKLKLSKRRRFELRMSKAAAI
jgi:hypothetical protein